MAYSSISKLASQTASNKLNGSEAQKKMNPSKFDEVRSQLEKPAGGPEQVGLQQTTRISPSEKMRVEAEFKKRLEEVRLRDLDEIFETDLRKSKEKADAIRQDLSSQPPSPAIDSVKSRLLQVENQFLESGRLLQGLGKMDSPEDYLRMQLQMYKMNQSVELLSRIAGEVVSGVNKVLNTQV